MGSGGHEVVCRPPVALRSDEPPHPGAVFEKAKKLPERPELCRFTGAGELMENEG
jgi:hypothetical protein